MKTQRTPLPQLSQDELKQLKWLLGGVLTLLSVATVFYLEIDAWTLMGLTAAVVVAALVRPDWPARIPRWGHRLAFPFIAAFFSADLWLTGELLPSMVRLDILLLLYRGIIYRKKREDLQVIVLGLFLLVVAGVLSVSLTFALHILAFTGCALTFLLVITLSGSSGSDGKSESIQGDAEVPAWARHVRWWALLGRVRRVTDWRVVALGSALFAGLVGLSALLFLAIPRFQLENSFFLERFISKKTRTGFSETIRFGDVTEITQDTSVALRVDVSDRSAIPAAPYWRMMVLDEYREGTFRLSAAMRRGFGAERWRTAVRGTLRDRGREDVVWQFYLESGVSRYFPLLGRFESLQFLERHNHWFAEGLNVLSLREEPVKMTAYRVVDMEPGGALPDENYAKLLRERDAMGLLLLRLGLDETDRGVLERVVREIAGSRPVREAGSPTVSIVGVEITAAEFCQRAVAWLRGRHGYSLQPTIPEGAGDPLVRWLGSTEGGHCELFAGSLVLLARAAGLPARVVTGFSGGSWNGYSDHFTVRNSDAHAWCEVFDEASRTWLRADPTPGASAVEQGEAVGDTGLAQPPDRSWTARLDSLRVFWYRRIVNFDQQSQMETLKAVKDATENTGRWMRERLERGVKTLRAWMAEPWDVARAAGGGLGAAVVVLSMLWWGRRFRFSFFNFSIGGRRPKGDAVRREAGRWLRRFEEVRAGNTDAETVAAELERLRFGGRETWGDAAEIFRRARKVWRGTKRRAGRARTPLRAEG